MRISQENVNSRRSQSDQSSSSQRTQTPFRLTFPKSARIRSRRHFQEITCAKNRFFGRCIVIDSKESPTPRLGITVPRQYGCAVKRSRFKRLVREVFRHFRHELPSVDLVVLPKRGGLEVTLKQIKEDVLHYAQSATAKSH